MQDGRGFIIATPEKALLDKLYFENSIQSKKEMHAFLFENLRIEEYSLKSLNKEYFSEIVSLYHKKSFIYLLKIIEKI